ncbi:MAG: zinc ribbon domain-containing protein [Bacillota bacterium]|nr:zinc ribbon domain-containing protein [Bacillota bacterium]
MYCRNCGQSMPDNAAACPNCGQIQATPEQQVPVASAPAYPEQQVPMSGAPVYPPVQQPAMAYQTPNGWQTVPQATPRKKRHGCLISFLVVLALLLLGAAAIFFLMPGFFRPVNLGVPTSQKAYASALDKLGYTKDEAPKSGQQEDYIYEFGAVKPVDVRMTNEEMSSFFNYNRPPYFPVSNVQVKVGSGTAANTPIEVSATVDRDYAVYNLLNGQFSLGQIQEGLESIGITKILPRKFNLYIKAGGEIKDNKVVSFDLYDASVMGVKIPDSDLTSADANRFLIEIINKLISDHNARSGSTFESVRVENGQIQMKGQIPSSLDRKPKP